MSRPADRALRLLRPPSGRSAERSEVRSAVVRFLLMGLTAMIIVAIPVALWIRADAGSHSLESAQVITARVAKHAVGPLVTAGALAGEPLSIRQLDIGLEPWLENGSVLQIKVWDDTGRIVNSDVHSLIGQRFKLPPHCRELLAGGPGTATHEPEHELNTAFRPGPGEFVEVYATSVARTGQPLIVEAHYDDDSVRQQHTAVLLGVAPALLLALLALQLANLVPAIRLARRIQGHQLARRRLLQRAIDASDLERRRIARDLHDEVIQDLSGLSYALAAEELHGDSVQRPIFVRARTILSQNVLRLRAMTSALYPPDLKELGLPAALTRLSYPLIEQGTDVRLRLPEVCDLDMNGSAALYRLAREALANIARHAHAGSVGLSLDCAAEGMILVIHDDGVGFDPGAGSPEGHLGLDIMRDTVSEAGGTLEVRSGAGQGTRITATLRRSDARDT